jgi:hypothetical protein
MLICRFSVPLVLKVTSILNFQSSSYTGTEIVQFLRDRGELTPQKLLISWDGASIPRSQEVKDWLRTEQVDGRVQLALRPASSPELNATEHRIPTRPTF